MELASTNPKELVAVLGCNREFQSIAPFGEKTSTQGSEGRPRRVWSKAAAGWYPMHNRLFELAAWDGRATDLGRPSTKVITCCNPSSDSSGLSITPLLGARTLHCLFCLQCRLHYCLPLTISYPRNRPSRRLEYRDDKDHWDQSSWLKHRRQIPRRPREARRLTSTTRLRWHSQQLKLTTMLRRTPPTSRFVTHCSDHHSSLFAWPMPH